MAVDIALFVAAALLVTVEGRAQIPVVPAPSQSALLKSGDATLARNKKLVYDFWRTVIEGGHLEAVDEYVSAGYIQHNPNVTTGRQALVDYVRRYTTPKPIKAWIEAPVVAITAEGDKVVVSVAVTAAVPGKPGQHYTTTAFDMFRIESGKIVEHWDNDPLTPAK